MSFEDFSSTLCNLSQGLVVCGKPVTPECGGRSRGKGTTIAMQILFNISTITVNPDVPKQQRWWHIGKLHVCPTAHNVRVVRVVAISTKAYVDKDAMFWLLDDLIPLLLRR
jgi:hypothetical protein